MSLMSKLGKPFVLLLIFLPVMTLGTLYLYQKYTETSEEVHAIIYNNLIKKETSLIQNFIHQLHMERGDDFLDDLHRSAQLRTHYETHLATLITSEVKYLYMLGYEHGKEKGKLLYILDTSVDEDERGHFHQKFDPESDIWEVVKKTKKSQVRQQQGLDTLWTTMVIPILKDDEVVAAIGVDFANEAQSSIDEVFTPLKKLYLYIAIFMVIMLVTAYVQFVMYYRTRKRSLVDPLTKIYNRQYLFELINTIDINEYQIMMIDLDYFKKINDLYGHDIGDIVLTAVSGRIASLIRKDDTLIRYGGEEFILLLHRQNALQCKEIAERILEAISHRPVKAEEHIIDMTLSIGINPYPGHAKNIDEAIKIADEQLYCAKSNGRNRIEIFEKTGQEQSNTSKHINDVKLAIQEFRIRCMYQPIYHTCSNSLNKYEVLVRMIDEEGNIIPPGDFLPSITHTRVYTNLTKRVLETALQTLEDHSVELSINLSLQDLFNNDILNTILELLSDNKTLANRLTFEILETEEITNFEMVKERIASVKETGAKIALDDFGSGYANFSYLVHLGIDMLKIDGSLIRDIDQNQNARNIVQTINSFADKMGMLTVAEQIETEAELATVKELGIGFAQGYYLGRPSFDLLDNGND